MNINKIEQQINWNIVMFLGFCIMVLVAIATIVTSFWGWFGAILCCAGWYMRRKRMASCPPPPTAE